MKQHINPRIQRHQVKTLFDLFKARVDSTPRDTAYSYIEKGTQQRVNVHWASLFQQFIKVRNALAAEKMDIGDRILLALPNGVEWIAIEQAAHFLGLVVVALPANESAARINHIISDTDAAIVFIESDTCHEAIQAHISTSSLFGKRKTRIVSLDKRKSHSEVIYYQKWIKSSLHYRAKRRNINQHTLATIVYTSGTTGEPKGVMHTHNTLLNNCFSCFEHITLSRYDKLLSTTPLSHIMERTAGYYVPMIGGASVCFASSENDVLENLKQTKANTLVTTPHTLDYVFNQILASQSLFANTINQFLDFRNGTGPYRPAFIFWPLIEKILRRTFKQQFTQHLKQIFCGGANLSPNILFISKILDIPLFQGYGLSETGIACVNSPKKQQIGSVGQPLTGTTISLSEENEIVIKSDSLMMGYWKNDTLSKKVLINGKFHTDDLGYFEHCFIHLIGRKSQQIQLSDSRKVSPAPIENTVRADRLFKNVSLFGENRDKLALVCQLCPDYWAEFLVKHNIPEDVSKQRAHTLLSVRVNTLIKVLPEHYFIDFIIPTFEPWNAKNKLLDIHGKVNKTNVEQYYASELREVYEKMFFE